MEWMKRALSLLLAVVTVITACPVSAFAAEAEVTEPTTEVIAETSTPVLETTELVTLPSQEPEVSQPESLPETQETTPETSEDATVESTEVSETIEAPTVPEATEDATVPETTETTEPPQEEPLVYEEYLYTLLEDGTVSICGYTGVVSEEVPGLSPEIPVSIDGMAVTEIAECAFAGNQDILAVLLPETIRSVGLGAFSGCGNLQALAFCGLLPAFGDSLFEGCDLLDTVFLLSEEDPASLRTLLVADLGQDCSDSVEFLFCQDATAVKEGFARWVSHGEAPANPITEPAPTVQVQSSPESDYRYTTDASARTATITSYTGSDTSLQIPAQLGGYPVVAIGPQAFQNQKSLSSVVLPEGLTSIGSSAFYACTGLKEVQFPSTLTHIYRSAFENCRELESIALPDSVQLLDYLAFRNCTKLSSINIPLSWNSTKNGINGGSVFSGCSSLTSITVPEGMTALPADAFRGANYLQEVILPSTLTSIGQDAFFGCSSLKSITLPDGLTHIYNFAFEDCSGIETVVLPDTVQLIGYRAFADCTKLSSINIPLSWNSASDSFRNGEIFSGCSSLISVTVPEGMTALPADAFRGATYLQEVILPSTLTSIGQDAFFGCSSLKSITLPDGLTHIYNFAFEGCSGIETVVLPDTVQLIGCRAFADCTKLSSINIPLSWNSASDSFRNGEIFSGCSSLISVTVPEGMTSLPAHAFRGATYLQEVILPSTLTAIWDYAFDNCKALDVLSIPASVSTIGNQVASNCDALQRLVISSANCSIGKNILQNSPNAFIYASSHSSAILYAIDNSIPFMLTSGLSSQDTLLDLENSSYLANVESIAANGLLSLTVRYALKEAFTDSLQNMQLLLMLPSIG